MPELPEVETVKRAFEDRLPHQKLLQATANRKDLRFPIPLELLGNLVGQRLQRIRRRGKYLLFDFDKHTLLSHLGMSGNWRLDDLAPQKHDHLIMKFDQATIVYNDPRRFGFVDVFYPDQEANHPRLRHLGPEPLDDEFNGATLEQAAKGRESSVKSFIMNAEVVVGVGNIYAVEALFRAGINPKRSVSRISSSRWQKLAEAIKEVLSEAIHAGGSSIRDYRQATGESGSFQGRHQVYGRSGEECRICLAKLKGQTLGGRATVWCPQCQK